MTMVKFSKSSRLSRTQVLLLITALFFLYYYYSRFSNIVSTEWGVVDLTNRDTVIAYLEQTLQEALMLDKGMGCEVPQYNPFSPEVLEFDKKYPKVTCPGPKDWVKCHLSECKVIDEILEMYSVSCLYTDIIYESDFSYTFSDPTSVEGDQPYVLERSDHVKIKCVGKPKNSIFSKSWSGLGIGFRKTVETPPPPPGHEDAIDILIFGFDSTSKNGFIRKMPNSYKYLKDVLGAIFLDSYNIAGDGTPAALFPLLTGKTEFEFPDARRSNSVKQLLDANEFIFNKIKRYGYHTAYLEDSPETGTFQYRFNGLTHQPADHYLRAFLMEEQSSWFRNKFCIGDTPSYKTLINLTEQFFKTNGKHFIFSFISDISHDDFNYISTADDDTVAFLERMSKSGVFNNTLMFFMGDHGVRFGNVRKTMQGKFEERLPLMAILLPETLKARRPDIAAILQNNTNVLTTVHDIHATILDAMGLPELRSNYSVKGADMKRGLTLFEPVPRNRSCSMAGIQPHWCTCINWDYVPQTDPLYKKAAETFTDYVNELTEEFRDICAERKLESISWVIKQRSNKNLVNLDQFADWDRYIAKLNKNAKVDTLKMQIRVSLGPNDSKAEFEASTTYYTDTHKFTFNMRDISRTNMYGEQPHCISEVRPALNPFCYCKDKM